MAFNKQSLQYDLFLFLDFVASPFEGFSGIDSLNPAPGEMDDADVREFVEDAEGDVRIVLRTTSSALDDHNAVPLEDGALFDCYGVDPCTLVVLLDKVFDFLFHNRLLFGVCVVPRLGNEVGQFIFVVVLGVGLGLTVHSDFALVATETIVGEGDGDTLGVEGFVGEAKQVLPVVTLVHITFGF